MVGKWPKQGNRDLSSQSATLLLVTPSVGASPASQSSDG